MKIGKNSQLESIWKDKLNTFRKFEEREEIETAKFRTSYKNSLTKTGSMTINLDLDPTDQLMLRFFIQEKKEFRTYGLYGIP